MECSFGGFTVHVWSVHKFETGGWKDLSNIMDLFERQGWINMDGQHIMSHNCMYIFRRLGYMKIVSPKLIL